MGRVERTRFLLRKEGLDGLLLYDEPNIFYLTGFPGKDSLVLVTAKGRGLFFTDSRVYDEAKSSVKAFEPVRIDRPDSPVIKNMLAKRRIRKLGFGAQSFAYGIYRRLNKALNKTRLIPTEGIVEGLRLIKTPDEISRIRKASRLTGNVFKKVRSSVRRGTREVDMAVLIDIEIRKRGGCNSFPTIVASGPHSAWPHATTSKRKFGRSDIVLMDFGAKANGYCSDLTRVAFTGSVKEKFKKMESLIRAAGKLALHLIRPGASISSVVQKVNYFIENAGFGKYILHGLGHGLGLEVHEGPRLSAKNRSPFKKGMVFTIEPGVYIPGLGGVRIEDVVALSGDRPEVLTK